MSRERVAKFSAAEFRGSRRKSQREKRVKVVGVYGTAVPINAGRFDRRGRPPQFTCQRFRLSRKTGTFAGSPAHMGGFEEAEEADG